MIQGQMFSSVQEIIAPLSVHQKEVSSLFLTGRIFGLHLRKFLLSNLRETRKENPFCPKEHYRKCWNGFLKLGVHKETGKEKKGPQLWIQRGEDTA